MTALRSDLKVVEKDWLDSQQAHKAFDAARADYLKLPALQKAEFSATTELAILIAIALLLELASSSVITIAIADLTVPARLVKGKAGAKSKEVDWIKAMKDAAKDPAQTGIHFDKDNLLKAPYGKLTDVFDVKSVSTAGQRIKSLIEAGKLEAVGSGRNVKYRVLEDA